MDGDFLEAVKRHILSRLQMRGRPNITHAVPKAAMVTALRKLHAGKVREDGRVEIPHLDGHASPGADGQERVSEIISFAETGGLVLLAARSGPIPPPPPSPRPLWPQQPASPPVPDSRPGRSPMALCTPSRLPVAVFLTQGADSFLVPLPPPLTPCLPPLLSGIRSPRLWARVPLLADA